MTFYVCKFKRVGKIKLGVKASLLLNVFQQMLTEMLIFLSCTIHFARLNYLDLLSLDRHRECNQHEMCKNIT